MLPAKEFQSELYFPSPGNPALLLAPNLLLTLIAVERDRSIWVLQCIANF